MDPGRSIEKIGCGQAAKQPTQSVFPTISAGWLAHVASGKLRNGGLTMRVRMELCLNCADAVHTLASMRADPKLSLLSRSGLLIRFFLYLTLEAALAAEFPPKHKSLPACVIARAVSPRRSHPHTDATRDVGPSNTFSIVRCNLPGAHPSPTYGRDAAPYRPDQCDRNSDEQLHLKRVGVRGKLSIIDDTSRCETLRMLMQFRFLQYSSTFVLGS